MPAEAVEAVYRSDWGRIVATLIRLVGDFDLAEESAQEAFAARRRPVARLPASRIPPRLDHPDGPAQSHRPHPAPGAIRGKTRILRYRRAWSKHARAGLRHQRNSRRPPSADLHLLPPGARAGGPGRADPAHAVRTRDRRDRARVSRAAGHHGAAAGARQAQDSRRAAFPTLCPRRTIWRRGSTQC